MKAEKIINMLDDSEEPKFATKNGMLKTFSLQKLDRTIIILSSLKQKLLNQVFVIILMHLF